MSHNRLVIGFNFYHYCYSYYYTAGAFNIKLSGSVFALFAYELITSKLKEE